MRDVVEGRTCPPDPFNDMSFSIGRKLQGVGRCKSPAPADIRVAPRPHLILKQPIWLAPSPLLEPRKWATKGTAALLTISPRCKNCTRSVYFDFRC